MRDRTAFQIRTGDTVTETQQHLGNTAHAGAADADKMNALDAPHFRHGEVATFSAQFRHAPPPDRIVRPAPPHPASPVRGRRAPTPATLVVVPRVRSIVARVFPASFHPAATTHRHGAPSASAHSRTGDRRSRAAAESESRRHPPRPIRRWSTRRRDTPPDRPWRMPPPYHRQPVRRAPQYLAPCA